MDFEIPEEIERKLAELDLFIEREIKPLERENIQFFDHRRENARTDWENGGRPRAEWGELLHEMRQRADAAGHLRFALPKDLGGQDGSNLAMAIIREHLAAKGLGLHNDLQNEASIVGNFPSVIMMLRFGSEEQKKEFLPGMITGTHRVGFGLTEPDHGSDRDLARDHGDARRQRLDFERDQALQLWSPRRELGHDLRAQQRRAPARRTASRASWFPPTLPASRSTSCGGPSTCRATTPRSRSRTCAYPRPRCSARRAGGSRSLRPSCTRTGFARAASGVGAAQFCIDESIRYAKERQVFGKPLWLNQAIQFPLAELQTECELVRNLVYKTAWELDRGHHMDVTDKVSMCNYRANRLVCEAADRAIQVHGGIGYTRHKPFEHIYRHHRRYRITEGSEEIQIRRVAGIMFGKRAKR